MMTSVSAESGRFIPLIGLTTGGGRPPRSPKRPQRIRPDGLVHGSAAAKLVDAAKTPTGRTHQELCKVVGWHECLPAVKKYVDRVGLQLVVIRNPGERVRYSARPKTNPEDAP